MRIAEADLTARARIRDAAIECFAAEGFGASVRTIASRAGVSAGLITHHFGSKDALRAECDDEVRRRLREIKERGLDRSAAGQLASLAHATDSGAFVVYMLRSLQGGGQVGRDFIEHMVDDARSYTAEAVRRGIVKPSRDEEARIRFLIKQTMGALLIEFNFLDTVDVVNFPKVMAQLQESILLPVLELYTEGVLTSHELLDTYLEQRGLPRDVGEAPASGTQADQAAFLAHAPPGEGGPSGPDAAVRHTPDAS